MLVTGNRNAFVAHRFVAFFDYIGYYARVYFATHLVPPAGDETTIEAQCR